MLKRKFSETLKQWKETKKRECLLVNGARQVGKTFIIDVFGRENYKSYIYLNLFKNPEYKQIFEGELEPNEIYKRISLLVKNTNFIEGDTLIFIDEIQVCSKARTALKFLAMDDRYDIIASGSLLGLHYNKLGQNSEEISIPVGYEREVEMHSLDFEEFAAANGVGTRVINALQEAFENKQPVDPYIHERMMSLFELYLIIGGMPAVVSAYLETKNLRRVADEQNAIIRLYKRDISKYDEKNRLYLNEIFDLIPSELNAKNKRFILKNLHDKARFDKYYDSFLWLKNAGVALPVNAVSEPRVPLLLYKSQNLFKLFSNDVGLLAAQYGGDIQLQILQHRTSMNFGAIYENVAAEELAAHGYTLYYYNGKKLGELDFVIEENGEILPIEIKSGKDYYRHNAIDNVLNHAEFEIDRGYVFCNGNVETADRLTYFPIYMLMFIQKKELPDEILFHIDFSDLSDK